MGKLNVCPLKINKSTFALISVIVITKGLMLYLLLPNIHHHKRIVGTDHALNADKCFSLNKWSFQFKSPQATYPSDLVHSLLCTTVEGVKVKLIKLFNKRETYKIP